jgi:hypothetical protein
MYYASCLLLFRRPYPDLPDLRLSYRKLDAPMGAISTSTIIYSYYHDAVKPETPGRSKNACGLPQ